MKRYEYLWLLVVCVAAFFVSADALQPDLMESRNLVTANEMVEYDNWLVPTMNGDLRLEKPPLPTWVAGAITLIAPDSLAAQRAAAGIMAMIWVLFLFLTVKAMTGRPRASLLCSLVFLSGFNIVLMGRTATWDIYCHAFMMGAIYLLWRLMYGDAMTRAKAMAAYFGAGIFMGLSFLSKGPVSFFALLLPFITACALICGRPHAPHPRVAGVSLMLLVTVALSTWWYLYIYIYHPELASAVIHKESGAWVNHNVRPWYYYWRFFTETGVWTIITLAAAVFPFFFARLRRQRTYLLAVVWMLVAVVLLSLMPEKKMRYLLPALAPCAMAAGLLLVYISDWWNDFRAGRILFRLNGWIITVLTFLLAGGVLWLWLGTNKIAAPVAIVAAILLSADGVWMARTVSHHEIMRFVDAVVVVFIIAETMLFGQITHFFSNPDFHSIAAIRHDKRIEGLPIYRTDADVTRMELVLAAGHRILPLHLADADSLLAATPCVLLTPEPLSSTLAPEVLAQIDTLQIGVFDDNRHPVTDRHYTQYLRNRVNIITKK